MGKQMPHAQSYDCAAQEDSRYNEEFSDCIYRHFHDTRALLGMSEYLRLITALFGYDITKGLTPSTSEKQILHTIPQRFRDCENDKVVIATIGSVLQICKTLATTPLGEQGAGTLDFKKFCSYVSRLYGCDLHGYDANAIEDFRYHVMAYLKGRKEQERADGQKP